MNRSTLALALALFAVAGLAVGGFIASVLGEAVSQPLRQPLEVSACPVDQFQGDDCVSGAPAPGEVILAADTVVPVAGRVCNQETVSYQVTVRWVPVNAGNAEAVTVVDTPVTYEEGCQSPYGVPGANFQGWAVPDGLLDQFVDAAPGEDLGRWRIVGTAEPTQKDTYATYQWDSVKTFSLVKG